MEESKNEKDSCVVCGKETPYPRTTQVEARVHYIEGAGQLCAKCDEGIKKAPVI